MRDLSDISALGISGGSGLGVRVGATRFLALEVMAQKDETFYGWNTRNPFWTESSYGLLFASWRIPGIGDEKRPARRWYDFFSTSRRRIKFRNLPEIEDRRHILFIYSGVRGLRVGDMLNVEVGISGLVGGLEVCLKPVELIDFILGWMTIDISQDDALRNRPAGPSPESDSPHRASATPGP